MTIPGLGKLTPVQICMIELSGCPTREFWPDTDAKTFFEMERLWAMKRAKTELVQLTGDDFGYDLAKWHKFLESVDDKYGYKHPYGWKQTQQIIRQRLTDPEAARLAKRAEELDDDLEWHRVGAPSYSELHPQIRKMLANLRRQVPPNDSANYLDMASAHNILVEMTGIDCGFDADKWESVLVTR